MAIMPKGVLLKPLSCMILAKTGNAVMLILTPMNKPKVKNVTPPGANPEYKW
jgi:hypothetical protein